MNNSVSTILFTFWTLRIVANVFSYVRLWYVKEYRFDRMLIHLRTKQGKKILFPPFRLPPLSPKAVAIVAACGFSLLFLFFLLPVEVWLRFIIVDMTTFPLTGLFVGLLYVPTMTYHRVAIWRAVRRIRRHKPMRVIGVTGSFGKTSTKEFLATIISRKYNVLKTEASKNSSIAIAETVLKKLKPDHEVLIVEMGAYKRGEIKAMAEMVQPSIGIVTAINAQHQDLFGSIEITKRAKYELLAGLIGKKIAIVNADNPHTRQMGTWAKRDGRDVWWYTTRIGQTLQGKTFMAEDIAENEKSISATIRYDKQRARFTANVLGKHQVNNVLAAIAGAIAAGMEFSQAIRAVSSITPFPKIMEPVKGIHGATFINDTFNNNPDAAKAAIAFLAKTKGRKMLVFQPMIELGKYGVVSHREVGREAVRVCDDVIITNDNFIEYFLEGARQAGGEKKVRVLSSQQAASYIQETVKKGDIVLFKGKEAERALTLCLNK